MTRQSKIFFRHVRQLQKWGMTKGRRKKKFRPANRMHAVFDRRLNPTVHVGFTGSGWVEVKMDGRNRYIPIFV